MTSERFALGQQTLDFLAGLKELPPAGIQKTHWQRLCGIVREHNLLALPEKTASGFQIGILDPTDVTSSIRLEPHRFDAKKARAFRLLATIERKQFSIEEGSDALIAQLLLIGEDLTHTERNWRLARGCGFVLNQPDYYAY